MLGIFNSGTDSDSDIEFSDSLTAQSANYKKMSITSAPKFNHDEDDWAMYKVQLEQFFIANDLEEKTREKTKSKFNWGIMCCFIQIIGKFNTAKVNKRCNNNV